ncbi:hypothetical protein GCM10025869_30180 [Homoserinibacter gongjuensis]|uniref:Putative pre-16S rRNA nuclease n=1 Tax=Homoserinibacter gongjuensis TaxID=1162968 RepID=A0ABQ6JWR7_9MICO|nr:hypothetical protein GCM10025869_30180 [Homoserinibacter gongjuensis]
MRRGVRVGVDVGKARVGVARCDPDGLLATPIETLPRDARTVAAVLAYVHELDAIEVVVGLPLSLSGADTASTTDARQFAAQLADASEVPVRLVDERLSTVTAHRQLQAGVGARRARVPSSTRSPLLSSCRTPSTPSGCRIVPRIRRPPHERP